MWAIVPSNGKKNEEGCQNKIAGRERGQTLKERGQNLKDRTECGKWEVKRSALGGRSEMSISSPGDNCLSSSHGDLTPTTNE